MRKDYIQSPEQKQTKKEHMEANRHIRSTSDDNIIKSECIKQSPTTYENYESVRKMIMNNTKNFCLFSIRLFLNLHFYLLVSVKMIGHV
jgi:hypothetical protein